ncbi:hypothetical protein AsAng_0037870 [Aureispira anguillae]|uniref:Uncharacterized protein n=1 Tax=Aureispira anguillae TaxID=2864201 RepID=A0A916DT90_9BACT|nr:hypothetical protein AsAng_0037870 [Aureispira anguillae]
MKLVFLLFFAASLWYQKRNKRATLNQTKDEKLNPIFMLIPETIVIEIKLDYLTIGLVGTTILLLLIIKQKFL